MQVFSDLNAEKIAQYKFDQVFNEAVANNEIVKAVVEALNWEFTTLKQSI